MWLQQLGITNDKYNKFYPSDEILKYQCLVYSTRIFLIYCSTKYNLVGFSYLPCLGILDLSVSVLEMLDVHVCP